MVELNALDYNNSSYCRVSVLYKVPSVLYILNCLIFTVLLWVLLLCHFFRGENRHSFAQDYIARAQFQGQYLAHSRSCQRVGEVEVGCFSLGLFYP